MGAICNDSLPHKTLEYLRHTTQAYQSDSAGY